MKVGFGRSDITPRLGVQLAGYGPYRNREARELIAPLRARAMVIEAGRRRVAVVSVELCGLPRALDARIREAVAGALRMDAAEVFLSSTHTHSAPSVGGMEGWGEADPLYVETLPARVGQAAREAWTRRGVVRWRRGEIEAPGIAVNRESDGGFALNANFAERMKSSWRPERPEDADARLRVLVAETDDGVAGVIHHFGCHPVVYGEKTNALHGDFVGEACAQLEATHAGAVAIFLPGGLGDINPKLNHRPPGESRRALRAISRQYARAVMRAMGVAEPMAMDEVGSVRREVRLTRLPWDRAAIDQRIRKLETELQRRGRGDQPHEGSTDALQTNGMLMARLAGLRLVRAQCRGARAPNPPVALHALRLGPVVWAGGGLEWYHRLAREMEAVSPAADTWPVSLVGGMGYAPDAAARRRAGYAGEFVPLICGEVPFRQADREIPAAMARVIRALG